jgi:integrase
MGTRRKSGGPYAARHALSVARGLFNWAIENARADASPCDRVKAARIHGSPKARDRVLSDDEIRKVWKAAEATPYPYGPLDGPKILSISTQPICLIGADAGQKCWSETLCRSASGNLYNGRP